jgi:hypothetical protein
VNQVSPIIMQGSFFQIQPPGICRFVRAMVQRQPTQGHVSINLATAMLQAVQALMQLHQRRKHTSRVPQVISPSGLGAAVL